MRDIRVAAAQFEHRDGEKRFNLDRIAALTEQAVARGAELVAFHECCVTGYTFLQGLSRDELDALAERVPDGPSVRELIGLARRHGVAIGAGLIEREPDGTLRKCYAVVTGNGLEAKHHKLHPFIHPAIEPGEHFTVF